MWTTSINSMLYNCTVYTFPIFSMPGISCWLVVIMRRIHMMRYGIMRTRRAHPTPRGPGSPLLENRDSGQIKTYPPISPMIETRIPSTDKKDENPSKFRWNPYFVSFILSTLNDPVIVLSFLLVAKIYTEIETTLRFSLLCVNFMEQCPVRYTSFCFCLDTAHDT